MIEKRIKALNLKNSENSILRLNIKGETHLYRDISNDYEMEDILSDIAVKTGIFHIDMKIDNLNPVIAIEKYLEGNNVLSNILKNLSDGEDISELIEEFSNYEFMSRKYKEGNLEKNLRNQRDAVIRRMIKW